MSTESLSRDDQSFFTWSDALGREDYVIATYRVETTIDPELCAIAMAKEQSLATLRIELGEHRPSPELAARVVMTDVLTQVSDCLHPEFRLTTEVYAAAVSGRARQRVAISIAYPLAAVGASLTSLWNVVLGEIPRLGFLSAARLVDIELPAAFLAGFPGPRYGVPGLRRQVGVPNRPLLCRSCRPAMGLSVAAMDAINTQVLHGGFDAVKDDELTRAATPEDYTERVATLAAGTRAAEQHTGERKLYFANAIDDLAASMTQAEIAGNSGADGIIVAPAIQGLACAQWFARHTDLFLLAHNTVEDVFTRSPRFGVSPAVYLKLQRIAGADLVFLPGNFGTDAEDAEEVAQAVASCLAPLGHIAPVLPIIAGGKRPGHLDDYIRRIGAMDFMIIAASAVDEHPEGIAAGARAFRDALQHLD